MAKRLEIVTTPTRRLRRRPNMSKTLHLTSYRHSVDVEIGIAAYVWYRRNVFEEAGLAIS